MDKCNSRSPASFDDDCTFSLEPQKGCTYLDQLVDLERHRHKQDIAFQKAFEDRVKRIEAAEKKLPCSVRGGKKRRRCKKRKLPVPTCGYPILKALSGTDDDDCVCYKKILEEERKRRHFVCNLEKTERKYERKTLEARKELAVEQAKAFRKCEQIQEEVDRQYGLGDKSLNIRKGDEAYKVFIHMDPGECCCSFQQKFWTKFKMWVYKIGIVFCISIIIIAFVVGLITKLKCFKPLTKEEQFDDIQYWELPK